MKYRLEKIFKKYVVSTTNDVLYNKELLELFDSKIKEETKKIKKRTIYVIFGVLVILLIEFAYRISFIL